MKKNCKPIKVLDLDMTIKPILAVIRSNQTQIDGFFLF